MTTIALSVVGVQVERLTGAPVVLLREDADPHRVLPIFIGPAEARSISVALAGLTPPRPGTHDLLADALRAIGAEVTRVEVTELRDSTFIADLVITDAAGERRVSSRPSDAVAIAVRVHAPVFAESDVLDAAGVIESADVDEPDAAPVDEPLPAELTQQDIDATVSELEHFLASLGDERETPPDVGTDPDTGDDAEDGVGDDPEC